MGAWRNRLRQASRRATATHLGPRTPTWDAGQEKGHLGAETPGWVQLPALCHSGDPLGRSLLLFETQLFLPSNERVRPRAAKTFKF